MKYDVIVIGGGHAGCEAAHAAARTGALTLLITMKIGSIGQMSCNPAIGGIGKSHLAREVDALDGLLCKVADNSALQRRKLNSRKGPAVQATRIQTCRDTYKMVMQNAIASQKNLLTLEGVVAKLLISDGVVTGVELETKDKILSKTVVLTTGTFLGGVIHIGEKSFEAGRAGDKSSKDLDNFFREKGFNAKRLKTGTPPRIFKNTIKFNNLEKQDSDANNPHISFLYDQYNQTPERITSIPCYITYTNGKTHEIIKSSQHLSPLFNGKINSVGPRYCPSIEDKVERFSDKNSHQVFLEPETLSDKEIYPNGLSTCLPEQKQLEFLHTIKGLENCIISHPGYAIEYSYFDPLGLNKYLQTKNISNLFFAGQINGTTGYEEAAAQGIIAGLNAASFSKNKEMWCPLRSESYIGVMIDDLTTLGVTEPYRMFTSRAEYRLKLREDNADERLTDKGYAVGLVSSERHKLFINKIDKIKKETIRLDSIKIFPGTTISTTIEKKFSLKIQKPQTMKTLLRMSDIQYSDLIELDAFGKTANSDIGRLVAINERYAGYLKRQDIEIEMISSSLNKKIPASIDYSKIKGLSNEAVEKLKMVLPLTLGQASRIPGVTPAIISLLKIYIKKHALQ
jgi:tRNA uridine 5-carboxymethylaminomethyl modification enzyme